MRVNIAKIWRGALDNPLDYPQLKFPEYLRINDLFSPFGVLCEIYTSLKQGPQWGQSVGSIKTFMGHSVTLPKEVVEWAGLSEYDVRFLTRRSHKEVSSWLTKTKIHPAQQVLVGMD